MSHHHHHHHHAHTSSSRILLAFLLNLCFSVFELVGGIFTGSVAILSDALHDLGDAAGIGCAYLLEKKSRKAPDATHTYGYARYSVLGGLITTVILLTGSCAVIYHAVLRLLHPSPIYYDGMLIFAVVGVAVNLIAALCTRHGESLNQRAVNLHMLEDVLGWAVVLVGAVVMRFTNWVFLDPLMSIGVAAFILVNALKNLKEIGDLFLEKTPEGISVEELTCHLTAIQGVVSVRRICVRSLDGKIHCADVHVLIHGDPIAIKATIRERLAEQGIAEVTIEVDVE
jgi:cobalt-zinc-cadmium efflux system protein